jgi:uncharacterized protein with HEPN domain
MDPRHGSQRQDGVSREDRKVIAQRHVLAHEYGEIQDDIMWRVATVSVPELISLLEPLMPPLPSDLEG